MGTRKERLVPYDMVSPGFEAVYTGERVSAPIEKPKGPVPCISYADGSGNVILKWSTWTWSFTDKWPDEGGEWRDEEIRYINSMQVKLGHLSDEVRKIRAHIGSLVPCDNGFPVTVDELLCAIGRGRLDEPSFHNGCWMGTMWWDSRSTQPFCGESMRTIYDVLVGYRDGKSASEMTERFPYARGFIDRTYEWLGPVANLTKVQRLMIERMLLPMEYFTGRNADAEAVNRNCFEEGGRGSEIDAEISALANLPTIYMRHLPKYRESLSSIAEPDKKDLYKICCHIASGVHGLSDCHHKTLRYFEHWIYGTGTGKFELPTPRQGTERERLGHLLFGYLLGLDRWLLGVPMHFVLLDLEYADLGFDPKNEVLRMYAHLGGESERNPTNEWLAACLWYNLFNNQHGGISRHTDLLERTGQAGVSVRQWMDSRVHASDDQG